MKKTNSRKTMKISFRIEDEYGNNVQTINNAPIDIGIGKLKGTLNTKFNRKSKSADKCFKDMMKGL